MNYDFTAICKFDNIFIWSNYDTDFKNKQLLDKYNNLTNLHIFINGGNPYRKNISVFSKYEKILFMRRMGDTKLLMNINNIKSYKNDFKAIFMLEDKKYDMFSQIYLDEK